MVTSGLAGRRPPPPCWRPAPAPAPPPRRGPPKIKQNSSNDDKFIVYLTKLTARWSTRCAIWSWSVLSERRCTWNLHAGLDFWCGQLNAHRTPIQGYPVVLLHSFDSVVLAFENNICCAYKFKWNTSARCLQMKRLNTHQAIFLSGRSVQQPSSMVRIPQTARWCLHPKRWNPSWTRPTLLSLLEYEVRRRRRVHQEPCVLLQTDRVSMKSSHHPGNGICFVGSGSLCEPHQQEWSDPGNPKRWSMTHEGRWGLRVKASEVVAETVGCYRPLARQHISKWLSMESTFKTHGLAFVNSKSD